jgi:DNA polymerase elongation subunit (family B)
VFRNCFYNSFEREIVLSTWDKDGKRVKYNIPFEPYLYVEDPKGEYKSIFNTNLAKKTFRNGYEKNKFLRDTGIKRVFGNFQPVQQFLIDTFWRENETREFSQHPLNVLFLDIETISETDQTFPNPEDPNHPIVSLACYSTLYKEMMCFGIGPYTGNKAHEFTYVNCKSEKELFLRFIEYLQKDYPDLMTAYNGEIFDFPYIINRCTRVCGEDVTKKLSPFGKIRISVIPPSAASFGKERKRYFIEGIAVVDYLEIYKRFQLSPRDSFKLDNIAEIELGENKVDFGMMSLTSLMKEDWNKFIEYNVQDVNLLVRLDNKLGFVNLLRMLAYTGLTNLDSAMGSIVVNTGAFAIKAKQLGQILSTFVRNDPDSTNPGAFVAEPQQGFQEQFIYFDASSLYPNTMITLNLSMETKVGRLIENDNNVIFRHVSGKEYPMSREKFDMLCNKEQLCISKNNIIFSQKKRGIIPMFLEEKYNERIQIRNKMKDLKKEKQKYKKGATRIDEIDSELKILDAKQLCIKIIINSAYGLLGNKNAAVGDDDLAAAITLTGQGVIKKAASIYSNYLKLNGVNMSDEQCRITGDTDSYSGDTLIKTNKGLFDAASLWDQYNISRKVETQKSGHEIIDVFDLDLQVDTYEHTTGNVKKVKIKNLIRHKVSKRRFKIKAGDKEIIMTEDHGCMVVRDGNLIEVRPYDILTTDKMVLLD